MAKATESPSMGNNIQMKGALGGSQRSFFLVKCNTTDIWWKESWGKTSQWCKCVFAHMTTRFLLSYAWRRRMHLTYWPLSLLITTQPVQWQWSVAINNGDIFHQQLVLFIESNGVEGERSNAWRKLVINRVNRLLVHIGKISLVFVSTHQDVSLVLSLDNSFAFFPPQ